MSIVPATRVVTGQGIHPRWHASTDPGVNDLIILSLKGYDTTSPHQSPCDLDVSPAILQRDPLAEKWADRAARSASSVTRIRGALSSSCSPLRIRPRLLFRLDVAHDTTDPAKEMKPLNVSTGPAALSS